MRLVNALKEDANAIGPAVTLLRKAQREHPDDFWINYNLAHSLWQSASLEQLAFARAAVAVRPQNPWARNNLGIALDHNGDVDEAIAEYREALRLDEDFRGAHCNLGIALGAKWDLDGAIVEYRQALRLDNDDAHYILGNALRDKGDVDGAIAEYREAIQIKKDYPEAHCNLGHVLRNKGQFAEALTYLRRGHELGSRNPRWPYPSAQWVKHCERLAELHDRLPAVLQGQDQPKDAAERLAFAQLCQLYRKRYAAAARFYGEAFAAQPDLAESLDSGHRYNAACAAALAGSGAGQDAAALDERERGRLRQQARDWLRADLDAWRGVPEKEPDKARPAMIQALQHWLVDLDFAGVRGPEALAGLPEAERPEWQKLWAEVADTLARAEGKAAAEKKSAPK
jgi:Tfp pilus assembly protein PilF